MHLSRALLASPNVRKKCPDLALAGTGRVLFIRQVALSPPYWSAAHTHFLFSLPTLECPLLSVEAWGR